MRKAMPEHAMHACSQAPELGERGFGQPVVDHGSSWVRRGTIGVIDLFIKTYDYPTKRAMARGWLRNTGPWVRSRAAAEFDAMVWLNQHGFHTASPLLVLERRSLFGLRRAVLVTEAHPGRPAAAVLPRLAPPERLELAAAIGRLAAALHRAGFRDRNFDLRNLLVQAAPDGTFAVAKIDSPRHRLVRRGPATDAWARADWQRLLPQLAACDPLAAAAAWQAGTPAWPLAALLPATAAH